MELSRNFIAESIWEVIRNPRRPLLHLKEGEGNYCALAEAQFGIPADALGKEIYATDLIKRLYHRAHEVKMKAAYKFIVSEIKKVIKDPTLPLPTIGDGEGSLCELAGKIFGFAENTLSQRIHRIDSKKIRKYTHDKSLIPLIKSIKPLYLEAKKAKRKGAYLFMVSEAQKVIEDPSLPLPNRTKGEGNLCKLAADTYHEVEATLRRHVAHDTSPKLLQWLGDEELVEIVKLIRPTYLKAKEAKKAAGAAQRAGAAKAWHEARSRRVEGGQGRRKKKAAEPKVLAILVEKPEGIKEAEAVREIYLNGMRWLADDVLRLLTSPSASVWFTFAVKSDDERKKLLCWSFSVFSQEEMGRILDNHGMRMKAEGLGFRFRFQAGGEEETEELLQK